MSSGGVWGYALDNSNATVQGLNAGQTLTDSFTVTTADGTTQRSEERREGKEGGAVLWGTSKGTEVEAGGVANASSGTTTATGTLTDTDVDNLADTFTAVTTATASTNGYGNYTSRSGGV